MKAPNLNKNFRDKLSALQGISNKSQTVIAYFTDLEYHLIEHIQDATAIVGCVAWLTNHRILFALEKVPKGISIIVQKEDFLRPDLDSGPNWRSKLRQSYENLSSLDFWPNSLSNLTNAQIEENKIEPVRCVGVFNRDKKPASPLMHHKFIVFCHQGNFVSRDGTISFPELYPYAVWTGSFNFTNNAVHSVENALYLIDTEIVQAYFDEWIQVAFLSEPLDWNSDWIQPEWTFT